MVKPNDIYNSLMVVAYFEIGATGICLSGGQANENTSTEG